MRSSSSYYKVYKRIYELPECERWRQQVCQQLREVSIIDVVFTLNKPKQFGLEATATPSFVVAGPLNRRSHTENGSVWFELTDHDFVTRLIKENFGKKVPTFNCDVEVVFGQKNKKETDSFYSWFENTTREEFRPIVEEARERIRDQYLGWLRSNEFKERRQNFLLNQAMQDIKMTLAAYRHLGNEVLKSAIEEFVVHSIMDD